MVQKHDIILTYVHDIALACVKITKMFLPRNENEINAEAKAKAERKEAYVRIEKWALDIIPKNIHDDLQVNVQEVACGDPNCSPIDTAIGIMFAR